MLCVCCEGDEEAVISRVTEEAPSMVVLDKKTCSIIFQYSAEEQGQKDTLKHFLKQLENDKSAFFVTDFSISMTTLEEVFLSLASAVRCFPSRGTLSKATANHVKHFHTRDTVQHILVLMVYVSTVKI